MCKEELNIEEEVEVDELDELLDSLTQKTISVNTDNVEDGTYSVEEFDNGLESVSKVCGMISGLVSAGLKPKEAIDYIMELHAMEHNRETMEHNLKMQKLVNEVSVEVAKLQQVNIENQQV